MYIQLKIVLTGGGGGDYVLQLPFCDSCMQERKIVRFLSFIHGSRFMVLSFGHLDAWSCSVPKLWVVSVLALTLSSKVPMFCLTEVLSSLSKREVSYCDQRECVHKSFCASPLLSIFYKSPFGRKTDPGIYGNIGFLDVVEA